MSLRSERAELEHRQYCMRERPLACADGEADAVADRLEVLRTELALADAEAARLLDLREESFVMVHSAGYLFSGSKWEKRGRLWEQVDGVEPVEGYMTSKSVVACVGGDVILSSIS